MEIDADAHRGWQAMDERTNAGYAAIASALGKAMAQAIDEGVKDPCWERLVEDIWAESRRLKRRKGRREAETLPEPPGRARRGGRGGPR